MEIKSKYAINHAQVITDTENTYNHTYVAIHIILLFYILFFFF